MAIVDLVTLDLLYEKDETAWLEAMAELALHRRYEAMDFQHLSEYLTDMSKRDRREVFSRMVVLMSHLLKWEYQPKNRSGSWKATMREQRRELRQLLESGTLRNHAETVLGQAYADACKQASDEMELAVEIFPAKCAWGLEELLSEEGA